MTQDDSLPSGTIIHDRYRIARLIAAGGMGRVYEAYHLQLNRRLALKEMMPNNPSDVKAVEEAQRLFLQEGRILRHLQNRHLPKVYDAFTDAGHSFLVMDYVEGETLADIQKKRGPIPEQEVRQWLYQLFDVLDYLHGQRPPIIFRDLKPGNIMRQHDGTIKLIDFGIARAFKVGQRQDTSSLVTYGFSPPEQFGKGQTDQRSDIYALGKTIWCLLTNGKPALEPGGIFHVRPASQLLPNVSPELDMLILHMVEIDPNKRPMTIMDAQQELLSALSPTIIPARPPLPHPVPSPRSRTFLFAGIATMVILAVLASQILIHLFTGGTSEAGTTYNSTQGQTNVPTHAPSTAVTPSGPILPSSHFTIYTVTKSDEVDALDAGNGILRWQFQAPLSVSNLTINQNMLYLTLSNNAVYALAANSGKALWHYQFTNTIESLIATQNIVYLSSTDETVYAMQANDGKLLWHYTTAGQNGVLLVGTANNVVYAAADMGTYFAAGNTLYALEGQTGAVLWNTYIMESNSPPLITDNAIYVGGDISGLAVAFQPGNGQQIWRANAKSGFSPPTLADGILYLSTQDNSVYALQAATGSLLWHQTNVGTSAISYNAPIVNNQVVYNWGQGYLYALQAGNGDILWHTSSIGSAPPVVLNGVLYDLQSGTVTAFRASNGSTVWSLGNSNVNQFATINGELYISSNPFGQPGAISALNVTNGSVLWHHQLDAPISLLTSS